MFVQSGGYPSVTVGEDGEWYYKVERMRRGHIAIVDPLSCGFKPFYISRQFCQDYHAHLFDRKSGWSDVEKIKCRVDAFTIEPGYRMENGEPQLL